MPWYAVYTKSRCEKKAHTALIQQGIESYCPTAIVKKQWSDRIKKVEQPIFTSYIFVEITQAQQTIVRQTFGVVNFVYWLGKPAVIKPAEIEAIKKFLERHENVTLEKITHKIGDEIEIEEGVFKGQKAIISKIFKNKIELVLPFLQAKLVATIKQ